jgi:CRP/FNR family transcriptional regulator, cyclic AMP receptor protein
MPNREVLLRQVPLFLSLRPEDTARLAELLQKRNFRKGDVLCRKGEEGNTLFMIISGKVKIARQSRSGEEVILAFLSAGDFCGEMALLDGLPRSADAIAVEDSTLYILTRSDFLSCVINNERAVKSILSTLSKRMRKADDFLADIFFLHVGTRLAKKLVELAAGNGYQAAQGNGPIMLNTTQQLIASMIGATRESVNKELRILRERGLIEISAKKIIILDIERLKKCIAPGT